MKTFIIALLLLPISAIGDTEHNLLFSVSTVSLIADWGTTLDIEKANNERRGGVGYSETNPHLGQHPSRAHINKYFTGLLILHVAGNYLFTKINDPSLRRGLTYFENFYVTIEHGGSAAGNYSVGLELNF